MNEIQKEELINLKNEGRSYKEMASALFISEGAIKSFFRREKLRAEEFYSVCKYCGTPLTKRLGNKKFCSDVCRYTWWHKNSKDNRECTKVNRCKNCNKDFKCYDNKDRKYCSHACYIADRFRNRKGNQTYDQ